MIERVWGLEMFCIYNKWATYKNLGEFCFVDLEKHDES